MFNKPNLAINIQLFYIFLNPELLLLHVILFSSRKSDLVHIVYNIKNFSKVEEMKISTNTVLVLSYRKDIYLVEGNVYLAG